MECASKSLFLSSGLPDSRNLDLVCSASINPLLSLYVSLHSSLHWSIHLSSFLSLSLTPLFSHCHSLPCSLSFSISFSPLSFSGHTHCQRFFFTLICISQDAIIQLHFTLKIFQQFYFQTTPTNELFPNISLLIVLIYPIQAVAECSHVRWKLNCIHRALLWGNEYIYSSLMIQLKNKRR